MQPTLLLLQILVHTNVLLLQDPQLTPAQLSAQVLIAKVILIVCTWVWHCSQLLAWGRPRSWSSSRGSPCPRPPQSASASLPPLAPFHQKYERNMTTDTVRFFVHCLSLSFFNEDGFGKICANIIAMLFYYILNIDYIYQSGHLFIAFLFSYFHLLLVFLKFPVGDNIFTLRLYFPRKDLGWVLTLQSTIVQCGWEICQKYVG